jgi:hypothetical protein
MVGHIVATLRQSPLVRDLEVVEMIDEVSIQLLRVRAELIDGSLLYVREAIFPHTSKYSYHCRLGRERCSCAGITLPIILKSPPIRITSTTGSA